MITWMKITWVVGVAHAQVAQSHGCSWVEKYVVVYDLVLQVVPRPEPVTAVAIPTLTPG